MDLARSLYTCVLLARASCRLGIITPALLSMLSVIEEYARFHNLTVVLLSGTDEKHSLYSGHDRGEAIDLKCHDLKDKEGKQQFLETIRERLGPEFHGALMHAGEAGREHFHFQLRRGVTYHAPPVPTHTSRFTR